MSLEERELERLVRTVVQEVLRQAAGTSAEAPVAMPSNPRLLVLLTADSTGLDVVLNQITRLQERGYDLAFCLPPEAKDCISPTTLHQALPGVEVHTPATPAASEELVHRYQALVVATLDRITAARVASTLTETVASALIFHALQHQQPVVAVRDAADPELSPPWQGPHAGPPALRQVLRDTLQRLNGFGVRLVRAEELADAVEQALSPSPAATTSRGRPVVTAAEVEVAEGELEVAANAIITPLAQDLARERGITIRRRPA